MTGAGDDLRGRLWGRPWFVVGLILALAATLALVLADDIRYLRLGIVAALWAALVGAFLAVRYRKQAVSTDEAVAQAQEVYELELEREIAARREYELEVEAETRQRMDADSRTELDALRAEVGALRDSLQSLFGGEVLLERVALTAQSTRMRALREEGRVVESGHGNSNWPAQLPAAQKKEMSERPTELIERVREKQPARPSGRGAPPEPRRPERSMDLPPRRVTKSEPASPRQTQGNNAAASVAKAAAEARAEQTRVNQAPNKPEQPPRPAPAELTRPAFSSSERSRPSFSPAERSRPSLRPAERSRPAIQPVETPDPADQPTQIAKALDADWTPSWENRLSHDRPVNDLSAAFPIRNGNGIGNGNGSTGNGHAPKPVEPEPEPSRPMRDGPELSERTPVARYEPERELPKPVEPEPPREEASPTVNPTLPEEVRRLAQQGRTGGRRRRAEDDAPPPPEPPAVSGGRRRRPDGEPPSWQAPPMAQPAQPAPVETGRRAAHSRPEMEPVRNGNTNGASRPNGRRAAIEESNDTGSHSSGRSVSELLAANGSSGTTPRRRRRADD